MKRNSVLRLKNALWASAGVVVLAVLLDLRTTVHDDKSRQPAGTWSELAMIRIFSEIVWAARAHSFESFAEHGVEVVVRTMPEFLH